ncbi:thiamine-phosphate kinase [Lusitaniella coriacea]|uniref:thiamine-phosphate kinase n=1 Tax=Lusitaniella coriacea TaxID=1983105 RepID=UPI003CE6E377
MNHSAQTVKEIGEQGVLKQVQRFCPANIVGDDGAIIEVDSGQSLVVTTDVLVEGVHFSDRTTSPEDVGWRAAAANLSDLAAMGASPVGITVGLSLPGDVTIEWIEDLYRGLSNCLNAHDTPILGGDICRSPTLSLAITALGQVLPHRTILRSAARPGDAIVVTGTHGGSRAGLELLLNPEIGQNLSPSQQKALIQTHQRPQPRLDVLPFLWRVLGESPVAGMDSSDGLGDAIAQICRGSGVGAEIEESAIPLPDGLKELVGSQKALEWALYGGEDFELVLCLQEALAVRFVEELGGNAAIIGRIIAGSDAIIQDSKEVLSLEQGFQHF